jgi:predicted flap endonuclease-1-like 5' DNA nuclease
MSSFWCNFLPIIVGIGSALLGGLIGWYMRRSRINALEEVIDEKNADYAHLKNAHEMLDIRHNNLQKENVSLSVSYNTIGEKHNVLEKNYTSLSMAHNALEEKVALLEKERSDLSISHYALEKKSANFEALTVSHNDLEGKATLLESLKASHSNLQEKIDILEEDLAAVESAKAVLTKHFVSYRTTAENRIQELEHTQNDWSQKHNFIQARYDTQNSRLAELEKMDDDVKRLKFEKERADKRIAELQEVKEEWESSYHAIFDENKSNISRIVELESLIDKKENSHLSFANQHETSASQVIEMQAIISQKEGSYQTLLSQLEANEQKLAELNESNQKWAASFEELVNEQNTSKAQIETLKQSLVSFQSTESLNSSDADNRIKLFEKELAELQDSKAQLEITRIKLENELDILRGSNTEISARYNELADSEKTQRIRLDYLGQQNFEQRIAELESELAAYKHSQNDVENVQTIEAESITVGSTPLQPDDLKVVEGIGPKIEAVLHEAGILTFEQLAQTDPEHINAILDAAGPRYRIHNPSTWPTQAELAAKNDWDKLKELKEQLLGGRDRATT